jgi:hypothetical protein
MRQLSRSDGSPKHPVCVLAILKAMTGAPNAGYLWEQHCEKDLVKLRCTVLENEPSAYYISNGPYWRTSHLRITLAMDHTGLAYYATLMIYHCRTALSSTSTRSAND